MMKHAIFAIAAIFLFACSEEPRASDAPVSWADALGSDIQTEYAGEEFRAFDFWIGEWNANWRARPQGEFYHQKEGSWTHQKVFPVLGGKALIELAWDRDKPQEASQRGFSIRYFDPARERWVMAQNWPNATNQGSAFTDQLIGDEHLGRLSMYSITERPNAEGEIVTQHRRYNFTDVRPGVSFRWDGSNTPDEGANWFTWYVVDFLRQGDVGEFGEAGAPLPGVHGDNLCTAEPHGALDGLQGQWTGTMTGADGVQSQATFTAGLALDGCGVIAALEADGGRTLWATGYAEQFQKWVIFRLDDQPGTTHAYFVSDAAGAGAIFNEAPGLAIADEFTPYLRPSSFEADGAARRIIFDILSEDELVLREEHRSEDGWRTGAAYRFARK